MKRTSAIRKIGFFIFLFFLFGVSSIAQDVAPMINLGNKYFVEKDYNLAMDQYDLALTIEENNPEALLGKAKVFLKLKNHNEAIDVLKQSINYNDSVPEAFLELGKIHFKFGNYSAAKLAFQAGIDESNEHGLLHAYLGAALFKLASYQDAEEKLKKALAYGDSSAYSFYYLSELSLQKDSVALAVKYIDEAISKNPNIPRFYLQKGDLSFLGGDNLWASLHYSTALRLNPDYLEARKARAKAYFTDEKYILALADLRLIVAREPDLSQAWADKADCEFALEKYDDAIVSYGKAFDLQEDYSWINKRAIAYQSLGDLESSIDDLRYLTLNFPQDPKLHFRLGNLYQLNSQYQEALEEYKKCVDIDRNDVLAWNNKAVVLFHLGKKEHACHIWHEILSKSFDDDYKEMAKQNISKFCRQE